MKQRAYIIGDTVTIEGGCPPELKGMRGTVFEWLPGKTKVEVFINGHANPKTPRGTWLFHPGDIHLTDDSCSNLIADIFKRKNNGMMTPTVSIHTDFHVSDCRYNDHARLLHYCLEIVKGSGEIFDIVRANIRTPDCIGTYEYGRHGDYWEQVVAYPNLTENEKT